MISKIILGLVTVVTYFFVHTGINLYNKNENKNNENQLTLAKSYIDKKDYKKSFEILNTLAQNNYFDEKCLIGELYRNGYGVMQNYTESFKWYSKCSNLLKTETTKNNLGYMYLNGLGIKQNYEKAIEYFKYTSTINSDYAQNMLGQLYYDGVGVQKNKKQAIELFKKSARNGNIHAKNMLIKLKIDW